MSKAMCAACGDVIESKHRNDFVGCKCGKTFVDGGEDYFRAGGYPIVFGYGDIAELPEDFDDDSFLDKGIY